MYPGSQSVVSGRGWAAVGRDWTWFFGGRGV